jgi:glucose/arabinose dehydrogenase
VDSNGCINSSHSLIASQSLNHGIYLSPDGSTLYASSPTTVYSWPYSSTTGKVGTTKKTIVVGMVNAGHITRTLIIPPSHPNLLVVSHGSNGNWDYPAVNPGAARAIVKVFDISSVPSGGYKFVTQGQVVGYGLRNEVGLAFDGNNMWVILSFPSE